MKMLRNWRDLLASVLRGALTLLAALWIFLEEWIWDAMQACMAWIGRLPGVRWCEARIAGLPPYAALVAFLIPGAILVPFKLFAFWLIARGHGLLGLEVFVAAKIVGTAFLARIFALTRPALLSIPWFARFHGAFTAWRDRVYAYVKSLPAWQAARAWIESGRSALRAWVRSRFGN
ncbi:MAG TPA: hypothetical protein VIW78_09835 [Burkholderiales bacterium]